MTPRQFEQRHAEELAEFARMQPAVYALRAGALEHARRQVEAVDAAAGSDQLLGHQAGAAAEVEHARGGICAEALQQSRELRRGDR